MYPVKRERDLMSHGKQSIPHKRIDEAQEVRNEKMPNGGLSRWYTSNTNQF